MMGRQVEPGQLFYEFGLEQAAPNHRREGVDREDYDFITGRAYDVPSAPQGER